VPASVSRSLTQPEDLGRVWWLPSNGEGNGLDDAAWAPIADVAATLVAPLLAILRAAGVPAYGAPASRPLMRRPRHAARPSQSLAGRSERPAHADPDDVWHLWVGTSGHARAEEVLRTALPRLHGQDEP
jgi:hypothetical protein